MRILVLFLVFVSVAVCAFAQEHAAEDWSKDYVAALKISKTSGRPVFAYFSGSNWCGFCKTMSKDILSAPDFQAFAKENLELVNLDFPRPAPQGDRQYDLNVWLKEQHEVRGFPTVLILDGDGVVLGRLGYTRDGVASFMDRLRAVITKAPSPPILAPAPSGESP